MTKKYKYNEIAKYITNIIELAGSWPVKNVSWAHKLIRSLWLFAIPACCLIVKTLIHAEFEVLSFGLFNLIIAGNCVAKYVVLFLNKSQFFKLLEILKHPAFAIYEDRGAILLKKRMNICKLLRTVYLYLFLITGILVIASPIPLMHSTRILLFPFPCDMRKQPFGIYVSVWFFQSVGTACIAWNEFNFDTILFSFIQIAVAQLEILDDKIIHSTSFTVDKLKNKRFDQNFDLEINRILGKCVDHHVTIDRYIKSIENTFTYAFFSQVLASLFMFCLLGFNFTLYPMFSVQSAKCFFLLMAAITQLTIFCIHGNEIINQSEKIRMACYMTKWNYCSSSVRKSLLLIMQRAERPFSLTAAQFATLSYETLLYIMKSAISYFTVLWQLYKNTNNF